MAVRQQDSGNSTGWTDACLLGFTALVKGVGGWAGGSQALLTDALNAVADAVRVKGTRSVHPSSLWIKMMLAALVLVGAIEASISGIGQLVNGPSQTLNGWAVAAFFVAVVIGEGLFILNYRRRLQQDRETAIRYAAEHRISLYASMLVAAGMALSVAGSGFDIPLFVYADPAASLLVAILVMVKALRLMLSFFENSSQLVARTKIIDPTPFIETVQRIQGVIEVRELKAQESLETVTVELVLSVNPRMTVKEAEEIAQRARDLLLHRFVQVVDVHVRVEPYHTGYPYKSNEELPDSGEQPTIVQ
ncbi:cation diffusion facilitator family transporter [Saccharibacillus sacchari]|uniref:Cation transporter n=1 Tax=Saccharibacillus sacchari TaxID=456493 RepID=A0ACC6PAT7_9BACL